MTPISLMPPVDYCPSCEGKKAESQAQDIGAARAQQIELQAADAAPSPGALPAEPTNPVAAEGAAKPVDGAAQPLLAPDLAVQALLARPETDATGTEDAALRLRSAQAYAGTQNGQV